MVTVAMLVVTIAMVYIAKWHVRVREEERAARVRLAREIARAKATHPAYRENWRDG